MAWVPENMTLRMRFSTNDESLLQISLPCVREAMGEPEIRDMMNTVVDADIFVTHLTGVHSADIIDRSVTVII